ncbi:Hypothetical_protein [Hexamita inflata]|uniref:Hypothetical_protein n=1 Tax=Hexamita inflata TaxID=28002 RepID=A0AA86QDL2_9EUKA|nr:Hypothetical protein HINF_LOCUS40598 [Hexamita inflata]
MSKYKLPVILDQIQPAQANFKNSISFFEDYNSDNSIRSSPNSQFSQLKTNLNEQKNILGELNTKFARIFNQSEQIQAGIDVIRRNNKRIQSKILNNKNK